jgi:hypothetical protein
MGDVSNSDVRGAADEALALLKTESMTDAQRKSDLEYFLDKLTDEDFNALTVLA